MSHFRVRAFNDDLDYVSDHVAVVVVRLRIYLIGKKEDGDTQDVPDHRQKPETKLRELAAQERTALRRCQARLALTSQAEKRLRVERLRKLKSLTDFEVWVIITLTGGIISQDVRRVGSGSRLSQGTVNFDVGTLLGIHCPGDLRAQMGNRRCFYRQASLLRAGIIRLSKCRLSLQAGTSWTARSR